MYMVNDIFMHFFRNDWCFENKLFNTIADMLSDEEKEIFNANPKQINWTLCS